MVSMLMAFSQNLNDNLKRGLGNLGRGRNMLSCQFSLEFVAKLF
jgi:hypothetical protein